MRTLPLSCLGALSLAAAVSSQSRLADIRPGSPSSNPNSFVRMGNAVYFVAETTAAGIELWRTDGTTAGTTMVMDINPAPGASAFPTNVMSPEIVAFGNLLLFWANDGTHGYELWRSDGTAAGTTMVIDANPGAGDSMPQSFSVGTTRVFYLATLPTIGRELWVTNGTAAGTHMVADFCPTPNWDGAGDRLNVGQGSKNVLAVGDHVLFMGSNLTTLTPCLCYSDGTSAGTSVADAQAQYPRFLTPFGSNVTFSASTTATGEEPWISNLTGSAASMLGDLQPGTQSSVSSIGYRTVQLGGYCYFQASTTVEGYALWRTDGTAAGTQPWFAPFLTDPTARVHRTPTLAGDRVYVCVLDQAFGNELYVTDGVALPTMVSDFFPGPNGGYGGVGSWLAVGVGRVAVTSLQASSSGGYELGATDGTAAGTRMLADLAPGNGNASQPREFTRLGDTILFAATDNGVSGRELYSMPVAVLGAADLETYGMGCAPTGVPVPQLSAVGSPQLGNASFAMRLEQALPSVATALCASFAAAQTPVGTCTLLVTPGTIAFYGVTDAQGRFVQPVALPNDQGLLGLQWFTQGFVLDPAGPLFGTADASNGLRVRLGN
jgi:ELWxxDGT repeat protein